MGGEGGWVLIVGGGYSPPQANEQRHVDLPRQPVVLRAVEHRGRAGGRVPSAVRPLLPSPLRSCCLRDAQERQGLYLGALFHPPLQDIIGFRFLFSASIADMLLLVNYAIWPGIVILFKSEIIQSGARHWVQM